MYNATAKPGGIIAADCGRCGWPTELRAPGIRLPLPSCVELLCPACLAELVDAAAAVAVSA